MASVIFTRPFEREQESLPSAAVLNELFELRTDGSLYHRHRPLHYFTSVAMSRTWNKQFAGTRAGNLNRRLGYRQVRIFTRLRREHRIIFKMVHGYEPEEVDHEDGNRQNNRPSNLVAANSAANNKNRSLGRNNKSGTPGVHKANRPGARPWVAQIKVGGKCTHIGCFATYEEAVSARKSAERENGFHANHGRPFRPVA